MVFLLQPLIQTLLMPRGRKKKQSNARRYVGDLFVYLFTYIISFFKDKDAEKESQHSTYEHISKSDDHFDAHMVDAGTQEQAKEVPAPADRQEEQMAEDEEMLDTPMEVTHGWYLYCLKKIYNNNPTS